MLEGGREVSDKGAWLGVARREPPPSKGGVRRNCELHLHVNDVLSYGNELLPVHELADLGIEKLVLRPHIVICDLEPGLSLMWTATLRNAISHNLAVDWHGSLGLSRASANLVHLPPPSRVAGEGLDMPATTSWRRRHRLGLCYYREGPGFALVKDVREEGAGARFTLDEPHLLDALRGWLRPRPLPPIGTHARHALDLLIEEHLVLSLGGWATVLPYRMNRWPIPYTSV